MTLLTLLAPTVAEQTLPQSMFASRNVGLTVECAFQTAPLSDSAGWENITTYARDITIQRGRSKELDQFQPSSATITLDTKARVFDPENSAGPFYGYVLPNRRIRVRAQMTVASVLTDFPLWDGFVDEWPQDYDGLAFAEVSVPCSDAFSVLANTFLSDSLFALELQTDIDGASPPTAWYRLGEASGTVMADTIAGNDGTYDTNFGDAPQLGQTGLPAGGSNTAVDFSGGGNNASGTMPDAVITAYPFGVEFLIQFTNVTSARNLWAAVSTGFGYYQVWWNYSPATLRFDGSDVAVGTFTVTDAVSTVSDGSTHHIAVVVDAAKSPHLYVDGVEVGITTSAGVVSFAAFTATRIGRAPASGVLPTNVPLQGTVDEYVFWDGIEPSPTRIAARADAALGWPGDTTTERATHILDFIGWSDAARSIGTGSTIVSSTAFSAQSIYDYLMQLVSTERGQCYIDPQGRVVFRGRTELSTDTRSTVSQATFTDANASYQYVTISPSYANREIRNNITVTRANGAGVTVTDTTSIAAYGNRSYALATVATTDTDSATAAAALLAKYKDARVRFDMLTIKPRVASTTLFPQALGREIGDLVTVVRTPQNVGAAVSKDVIIEGISHVITPEDWVTSFNLSPA